VAFAFPWPFSQSAGISILAPGIRPVYAQSPSFDPPGSAFLFGELCSPPQGAVFACRKDPSFTSSGVASLSATVVMRSSEPQLCCVKGPLRHVAQRLSCENDVLAPFPSHAVRQPITVFRASDNEKLMNYTTLTQMGTRWIKFSALLPQSPAPDAPRIHHECWMDRHLLERLPKTVQGNPSDSLWVALSLQIAAQLRRQGNGSVQETFPKVLSFPSTTSSRGANSTLQMSTCLMSLSLCCARLPLAGRFPSLLLIVHGFRRTWSLPEIRPFSRSFRLSRSR
jgi:hypothetical protein